MKKKRIKKKRIAQLNKKGKLVTHSDRYWADQELEEWEKQQLLLACKFLKRENIKLRRLQYYGQLFSFSIPSLKQDIIEQIEAGTYDNYFKGLNVDHLKDENGNVKYWGDIFDSPAPRLLKNGFRSPEDLILNPGRIKNFKTTSRTRSDAKMMIKLMRRLGISNKRIRISEQYLPVDAQNTGDWILSDAKHGTRKFISKKKAIKACDQPYSLLTFNRSGEDDQGRYNFKRYRVRIVDNKKLIKLLEINRNEELKKLSRIPKEKCKNCGNPIHPLEAPLVTSWESVNGIQRAKSVWCKNCESLGREIAKKRRKKIRKLRKLENKNKRK